jgi:UDP-glucose 4-epimerase
MINKQLKELDTYKFTGKRIIVTGGAGFIGSHLAEWLLAKGCNVTIVDTFLNGSKIEHLKQHKNLQVHKIDVRDYESLSVISRNADMIFHFACVVGVEQTQDNPGEVLDVEILGTRNVLLSAAENNVGRVIVASSSEVYGDTSDTMVEDGVYSPRSTYAVAKQIAEEYCKAYYQQSGVEYTLLRFFNVYGPRQDERFVVSRFTDNALKNQPVVVYGDGRQTRDFTYIDDCIAMTLLSAIKNETKCEVLNIGTGISVSINELASSIINIVGSNSRLKHKPYGGNRPIEIEVFNRTADINKAEKLLHYKPEVLLKNGLQSCIKWYRDAHPSTSIPTPQFQSLPPLPR